MSISLAQAQAALASWLAADLAVSNNQEYSIDGRTIKRSDAATITEKINYWSRIESQLSRQADGQPKVSVALANFNL